MLKNQADVGIRPYVSTFQNADRLTELSKPVSLYSFGVAQFLYEPTATQSDLSNFLVEQRLLIYCVLIGYLVPLVAVFAFSHRQVSRSIRSLRIIAFKLIFSLSNQIREISHKLALIFAFFGLFLFIIRTSLTNLINTNAIVLDTSQFINSRQRLFGSPKTMLVCGNPLETDSETIKTMGNTFSFKLYSRKQKEGRLIEGCLSRKAFKSLAVLSNNGLINLFFFMNREHCIWFLSFFVRKRKGPLFIYLGHESYLEDSVSLQIRRTLPWGAKQQVIRR